MYCLGIQAMPLPVLNHNYNHKAVVKTGTIYWQCRDSTIGPTQLTLVLGYCYLFKMFQNPILTLTLMLDPSATYS